MLAAAVAAATDPVHRRNLEVVLRHITCEVAGDIEGVLATLVPEPTYRIWGASSSPGPRGGAEVRAFYEGLVASGKNRLEYRVSKVVVDDRNVVTEGEFHFVYPGTALAGRHAAHGEAVDPDGWYHVAYQALVVWPVDAGSGLLEGEDIYAGEVPRILARVGPGELAHLGPVSRAQV
ncbi:MAG TPA: nuclear transport factor 2 family protein [Acidimicrobiia bacterium]|nr:nuclear transport factor 2 family protein [Acidimicrobiia bacterium]